MNLISIIGEFDTTLLNIVNEFKKELKNIILVFDTSTASKKNIAQYSKMLQHFKEKYQLAYSVSAEHIIDEDNVAKIDSLLDIVKSHPDTYLNISHALGSTSAYIGSKINEFDFKLISFNPYDNEYNVIDKMGFKNYPIMHKLMIIDFLESYGYEVRIKRDTLWVDQHKEDIYTIFEHFKQYREIRQLLSLKGQEQNKLYPTFKRLNIFDNDGNIKEKGYLEGGLFEDYVYLIVKELGFDDVLVGAEIIFDRIKDTNTLLNNEFDILAFKNNRLYLFECKFTKSFVLNDLIYKYMALKEYIKNDSKGVIVTYSPKISQHEKQPPEENSIKLARKKAQLFDLHVIRNILEKNQLKTELFKIVNPGYFFEEKKVSLPLKQKKFVYFLGGHDLEMNEIKLLLEHYQAKYFDKKLSWGAKVSDYKEELIQLKEGEIPVFIELEIDFKYQGEFENIDHHGPLSHFPSSLEQVAQRFNHPLTRFQQLVSINDKAYKIGLKRFGASSDEIKAIRYMDRQKQGVTENDEALALKSIETIKIKKEIPCIYSLTPHFSAVADLVDFQHYLIYDENKICVYTYKSKVIKKLFTPFIEKNNVYYGGKEQMFFGIKNNVLSKEQIENFLEKIVEKLTKKDKK
jgi:hypothetical protein